MEKKMKLGLAAAFLAGVVATLAVGAWFYYPKYKLDGSMERCNQQFGVGPEGVTDEALSKFPSQQAFEAAYTACVHNELR